jgi:osmoprotectant transport system permease protein
MGLRNREILWRIEVPLALPSIMAGLRIAVVTMVSLATLAAFVVPEGLGHPIFIALRDYFKTEIIAAGALAVLLALVFDALLVLAQRVLTPWARARAS